MVWSLKKQCLTQVFCCFVCVWNFVISLLCIVKNHRRFLFHMCCVLSRSLSCDPMDYSPPGSSVHGDSPGKNTGMDSQFLLQGIVLTQGSNSSLPHCRWILYHWATVTDISFCFYFFNELSTILVFPAGSDGKESAWNVGDLGSILG